MELEKIKLLLFDTDQYAIFEHIPKPVLFEPEKQRQIKETQHGHGYDGGHTDLEDTEFLLTSGATFWNQADKQVKMREFFEALERIKRKTELNQMDKKLLEIVGNFD